MQAPRCGSSFLTGQHIYIAQITSRVCMNTNHIHAQLIPALLEQRRVVHTRQAPQTAAGPVLAPTDILCAGGAERLGIVAETAPLGGRELEGKAEDEPDLDVNTSFKGLCCCATCGLPVGHLGDWAVLRYRAGLGISVAPRPGARGPEAAIHRE